MFDEYHENLLKKLITIDQNFLTDEVYAIVSKEIDNGYVDAAAHMRAVEQAEGDGVKAKGLYIKNRVRRIIDMLKTYREFRFIRSHENILNDIEVILKNKNLRSEEMDEIIEIRNSIKIGDINKNDIDYIYHIKRLCNIGDQ